MRRISGSYPAKCHARIEGSKALTYLLAVADGDVEEPCEKRISTCQYLVNKVLPNAPTTALTHELKEPPGFTVVHGD